MTLTQSEINAFKLKEKAVEDVTDCVILAEALVAVGEKEWANKIFKETESACEEDDYNSWQTLAYL